MQDKNSFEKFFPKYDYFLVDKLLNAFNQGEGSIFNWSKEEYEQNLHGAQIAFHEKVLNEVKPKLILETGTHKANYAYIVKINVPDVKVLTFGNNEESQLCVDILNDYFKEEYITFICGDSKDTLSRLKTDKKFDIAWVDGGHDYQTALMDLENCVNLGIKNILVDDTSLREVRDAVDACLVSFNLSIKDVSKCNRQAMWLVSNE